LKRNVADVITVTVPNVKFIVKKTFWYNGSTNALVCIKTLIKMSQTKTIKITPTCFVHQIIIIRELFDPG
jgi:hypothetical protein